MISKVYDHYEWNDVRPTPSTSVKDPMASTVTVPTYEWQRILLENEALRAENERLRESLRAIRTMAAAEPA